MGAAIAFVIVVVAGLGWLIASAVAAGRRRAARHTDAVSVIAAILDGGTADQASSLVRGRLGGSNVTMRWTSRGAGSSSVSWTEVDVMMPRLELVLDLRPQTKREERLIASGLAVDVILGGALRLGTAAPHPPSRYAPCSIAMRRKSRR